MDKTTDFRRFCKKVDDIFKKMGGYKTSTASLKLLFYAAFSNYSVLKGKEIPATRMFKNNLIGLLELSASSVETGILRVADDCKAFSEKTDLPVESLYFDDSDTNASLWDCFPRHISRDEFLKPADCVESIFLRKSLLDWKMIVEDMFSSALKRQSIFEFSGIVDNAIEIYLDLFKLIEITHIIMVRSSYLDI